MARYELYAKVVDMWLFKRAGEMCDHHNEGRYVPLVVRMECEDANNAIMAAKKFHADLIERGFVFRSCKLFLMDKNRITGNYDLPVTIWSCPEPFESKHVNQATALQDWGEEKPVPFEFETYDGWPRAIIGGIFNA